MTFLFQFSYLLGGSLLPLREDPLRRTSAGEQSHGRALSGVPPQSSLSLLLSLSPSQCGALTSSQGKVCPALCLHSGVSKPKRLGAGCPSSLGQPPSETETVMARCHMWESHRATETLGNLSTYCPYTGTHTASQAKTER